VIAEYALPDESRAILRARRIPPVLDVAPSELARRVERAHEAALADYVRDTEGLRVSVSYRPEAIVRGEVDRVRVEARAATVGELKRRGRAPLRVRDARIEVERLLIDPRRLVDTGTLEILDAGALRIDALAITQADLDALLRGQPEGALLTVQLGDGAAEVKLKHFPAEARVGLRAQAADAPLALEVEGVRIAGVPVPGLLVDWVVRHFDPTPRLRNLPVPVSLAAIRIRPGRVEIGAPVGADGRQSLQPRMRPRESAMPAPALWGTLEDDVRLAGVRLQHGDLREVLRQQRSDEPHAAVTRSAVRVEGRGHDHRVLRIPFQPFPDLSFAPQTTLLPDSLVGDGG
jgi:DUF2993 family protein